MVEPIGYSTSVAFTPDGRMLFNETGGLVKVRSASGAVSTAGSGFGAIYSIAVDKDFAANRYIYVLYMTGSPPDRHGQLARMRLNPDNTLAERTVILGKVMADCQPSSNTDDCIQILNSPDHAVGTVISDPVDGTLWVSNGDNAAPRTDPLAFRAQDPNTLAGKMLHIDRNGNGLPGHPFCPGDNDLTHNCTKVHALGLRNTYRFALRPSDRMPIGGDVGWNTKEEINVYRPGRNYGWPCWEGTGQTTNHRENPLCAPLYAAGTAVPPVYEYPRTVGKSVIMGAIVNNPTWPAAFQGEILFGDYVDGWIKRMRLDAADRVVAVNDFVTTGWAEGVNMTFGPEGDLYYTLSGGQGGIRKIRSAVGVGPGGVADPGGNQGGANSEPTAVARVSRVAGALPLRVTFSARGSKDSDGDRLTYRWSFGDRTRQRSGSRVRHVYRRKGNFTAILRVSDGRGGVDTKRIRIFSGNRPPRIKVSGPSRFRAGVPVRFTGRITDPDGRRVRARDRNWTVQLYHRDHNHPMDVKRTSNGIRFTPVTDHDADTHYVVRLDAKDRGGAPASRTVRVRPRTSRVVITTVPSGIPVSYGDSDYATPFVHRSPLGFRTTIAVPASYTSGGVTYTFARWSDRGERQHDIVVKSSGLGLVARYAGPDGKLVSGTPSR